jgi:uncharacterized protein (UPF0333 family)
MEIKGGSLSTYNENGKLISVVENYKKRIISKVIYEIYKKYPGWQIVNDKYLYSQKKETS